MSQVMIGSRRAGGYVEINVGGYEHPLQTDYSDGNWLLSRVRIEVEGFSAKFGASLRAEEFEQFAKEVDRLDETLTGKATYKTLEGQLTIELVVDHFGHISVRGQARNQAGGSNRLEFGIPDFDQSYLKELSDQLSQLLATHPVRGR